MQVDMSSSGWVLFLYISILFFGNRWEGDTYLLSGNITNAKAALYVYTLSRLNVEKKGKNVFSHRNCGVEAKEVSIVLGAWKLILIKTSVER